jgi:hypothetical protein
LSYQERRIPGLSFDGTTRFNGEKLSAKTLHATMI